MKRPIQTLIDGQKICISILTPRWIWFEFTRVEWRQCKSHQSNDFRLDVIRLWYFRIQIPFTQLVVRVIIIPLCTFARHSKRKHSMTRDNEEETHSIFSTCNGETSTWTKLSIMLLKRTTKSWPYCSGLNKKWKDKTVFLSEKFHRKIKTKWSKFPLSGGKILTEGPRLTLVGISLRWRQLWRPSNRTIIENELSR